MKLLRVFIATIIMVVGASAATTASAQFRFGVKAGVNISHLSFSEKALEDVFSKDNQAGFTGGIMAEFTVPLIGVGADVSAMYVRRNAQYMAEKGFETDQRDYIEIPVNLKWKISIPAAGNIVSPYIFTGPSFAILASKKAIVNAYENKAVDTSWNVGVGLQFVNHLQIGASYAIGMNKTIKSLTPLPNGEYVGARSNYWTITAAWLF
ncbi:MAG: PorT family protein [Muribaculaceae bacterium]|nr:PorT family protein [Muribaculaceae bacterium]